jgi:hypothetical protein
MRLRNGARVASDAIWSNVAFGSFSTESSNSVMSLRTQKRPRSRGDAICRNGLKPDTCTATRDEREFHSIEVLALQDHVCFAPANGHRTSRTPCPKSGHLPTIRSAKGMSALPSEADIGAVFGHVGFVPIREVLVLPPVGWSGTPECRRATVIRSRSSGKLIGKVSCAWETRK